MQDKYEPVRTPPRPHTPVRPIWLCRACAHPWPCAVARLTLTREYANDRITLCLYLSSQLHDAIGDLYRLDPDRAPEPPQLFARFLGWARLRMPEGP